jgi:hypothetical protein
MNHEDPHYYDQLIRRRSWANVSHNIIGQWPCVTPSLPSYRRIDPYWLEGLES